MQGVSIAPKTFLGIKREIPSLRFSFEYSYIGDIKNQFSEKSVIATMVCDGIDEWRCSGSCKVSFAIELIKDVTGVPSPEHTSSASDAQGTAVGVGCGIGIGIDGRRHAQTESDSFNGSRVCFDGHLGIIEPIEECDVLNNKSGIIFIIQRDVGNISPEVL